MADDLKPVEADWCRMFETLERIALYDAEPGTIEASFAEWARLTLGKLTARMTRWSETDD